MTVGVSRVRRCLQTTLRRWDVPDDTAEDAVLVAAELLENVVIHANTPFQLTARLHGPMLRITVSDGLPASDPPTVGSGTRWDGGLRLVSAAALRWGWQPHPTGKSVWADFLV
jgi:Histidine kinase-like ATPase domain